MNRQEEILDELYNHTLDGEAKPVVELTKEGLALGMDPMEILFSALIPALEEVGRLFESGEYFVPEMLIAARAMQGAMDILKPPPAHQVQRLKGGLGILMDDLIAGLYALALTQIVARMVLPGVM